ncbi:sulfotransferase family 2 domain-containing protein [Acuticoccus sp. I52.16.1]|uniref:sulfotransferase family 2 domain-containing protein n=1 Tax=Acuticoccus sp. I52.16.1 TaxID=2928472 RepID=UPI001FD1E00B|nr:sulfotransferase family 2 domain-containing protein [Acuticoccus sp. I52.16.1]UOM36757.1 sulfotransferase family protein [Acuticoccus sp. I52.16.1]
MTFQKDETPSLKLGIGLDNRPKINDIASFLSRKNIRDVIRQRSIPLGGGPHFWFEIGGVRYLYTYIRKNGCSSFKHMIAQTSEHKSRLEAGKEIDFLREYHLLKNFNDTKTVSCSIFVYRNPVERVISLFKNKFIIREWNSDIWESVHKSIGNNPEKLSFNDFVFSYIQGYAAFNKWRGKYIDPHVKPQVRHLAPIFYNTAVDLADLTEASYRLFPAEVAEKFFREKINSTSAQEFVEDGAELMPSEILRRRWKESRSVPSRESLMNAEILKAIEQVYSEDYAMIAAANRTDCM